MAQSAAPTERDVVAYVELLRRTNDPLGLVLRGQLLVKLYMTVHSLVSMLLPHVHTSFCIHACLSRKPVMAGCIRASDKLLPQRRVR